jgi:hypothetical protein
VTRSQQLVPDIHAAVGGRRRHRPRTRAPQHGQSVAVAAPAVVVRSDIKGVRGAATRGNAWERTSAWDDAHTRG